MLAVSSILKKYWIPYFGKKRRSVQLTRFQELIDSEFCLRTPHNLLTLYVGCDPLNRYARSIIQLEIQQESARSVNRVPLVPQTVKR